MNPTLCLVLTPNAPPGPNRIVDVPKGRTCDCAKRTSGSGSGRGRKSVTRASLGGGEPRRHSSDTRVAGECPSSCVCHCLCIATASACDTMRVEQQQRLLPKKHKSFYVHAESTGTETNSVVELPLKVGWWSKDVMCQTQNNRVMMAVRRNAPW